MVVKVELPPLSPDSEPTSLEGPDNGYWGKEEKLEEAVQKPKKR